MSKVFAYVFAGSTEPGEIYASFIIPPYLKMTTEYAEKKTLFWSELSYQTWKETLSYLIKTQNVWRTYLFNVI